MKEGTPRDIEPSLRDRLSERMGQGARDLPPMLGEGYWFEIEMENAAASPDDLRRFSHFEGDARVEIQSPHVEISFKNPVVQPARDGIRVDSSDGMARALFLRDGHIAVEVFPSPTPEPVEPPLMAGNRPDEETSASSLSPRPGASDDEIRASESATQTPQTGEQKERQPRVKFTGRLGGDPHFEQSQKSGLIARFPVAENAEADQVTWHRVYSTGKSAERIRNASLAKGDKVKVDGYRQPRDYRKKDGSTVKQEVVFAVHVKKLGNQRTEEQISNE